MLPVCRLLFSLVLALSVTLCAQDEAEEDEPAPAAAPRALKIERPEHPYTIPEGPAKPAWALYLKNDLDGAEKGFREALAAKPGDLATMEGLRATLIAKGQYRQAQEVNLQMVAAASDSPLCSLFARRATDILSYVENRKEAIAAFEAAAVKAAPAVRAALNDTLASLYLGMDQPAKARELLQGLGYVNRWVFAAGPFGRLDQNNPMARRFAPERALNKLAFEDERGEQARVARTPPVAFRSLDLAQAVSERTGVYYALANLESEAEQEALILFGAPAGTRAFLRGLPILTPDPGERFPRSAPIVQARLMRGANPLLVKLPFAADLAVRVLDLGYAPLASVGFKDLDEAALAVHEVVPVRGFLYSNERQGTAADFFLERLPQAEREKGLVHLATNGSLNLAEAHWMDLSAQRENDIPLREAVGRTLFGSFPDAIGPLDLGAVVLEAVGRSAGHTASRHAEEARQLRERALGIAPESHQHLLGMYFFYSDRQLNDQAFDMLKRCTQAHPQSGLAWSRLGQMYQERNLPVQAELAFEKAAETDAAYYPELARFHQAYGNRARARDLEAKMTEAGMTSPLKDFNQHLLSGRLEDAEKLLAAQEQGYPERKEQFLPLRAALLEEKGDLEGSLAIRRKLYEAQPEDGEALQPAVDLALRAGKREVALELLRFHTKEHPGDYMNRRRLRELELEDSPQWWAPYDIQVREIDTRRFVQENYERSNHAWIVDFMVTKVYPDLSQESYVHIAQKVLNLDGIQELSEALVQAQRQDIVFIRTVNPDGSVFEPQNVHDFNLAKSASFYKVGPGSILEHAYLMHQDADPDHPALNLGFNFMALDAPRAVSRWIVMLPEGHNLEIRKICPELIEEKILEGPKGYTVYQWTNKEVEGIKVERFMPSEGDQEVVPLVTIESPERRHRATGWLLRHEQHWLPDKAKALAQSLVQPLKSNEARFRALVEWVRTNIKPGKEASSLEDVWDLRSGNTGQMTDLAVAMCRAVELDVREARVNGSYVPGQIWKTLNRKRDWEPAHFTAFGNGGRMMVLDDDDGPDVWLQFTGQPARFYSAESLFENQAGALALTVGEEGLRIRRVRGEELGEVPATHWSGVDLDEQGAGHIRGALDLYGFLGGRIRETLEDPRRAEQVKEGIVRRFWPSLQDLKVTLANENNPDEPLRLAYAGTFNNLGEAAENAFFVQPFRQQAYLLQLMGPGEREHDLLVRNELAELDNLVTYMAPRGHAWVEVPDDLYLVTEFGFYVADFNVKGRKLTCTRSFLMPAQRVVPGKYPALMDFLRRIAEVERQRVAYAKAARAGFAEPSRVAFSLGYASHGGEDEEQKAATKSRKDGSSAGDQKPAAPAHE